ncbi:Tyrosine phosphatase family protein [Novymonas esmeraldas]|uniref:Tyrosine phosphatase family protein n=1 Tax=Novymonas esmeraldas TaxID=1808958 RepID=A0AAW0EQH8_9TRYP
MKRVLELPGTTNFRDLGGYATASGRRVREGVVFRSDSLHNVPASAAEEVLVGRLRLSHTFDFRSPEEVLHKPYAFAGVEHVLAPIGGSMLEKLRGPAAEVTPEYTRQLIHATYRHRIDHYGHQLARVLHFLAGPDFCAGGQPQRAIVFHCTAGKDRTGLMAAVLLHLLGVPRAVILEDYMLTRALLRRPAESNAYYDDMGISSEAMGILWGIDAAYLDAALDYIAQRHGGIDAYVRDALRVDDGVVERLRARLLV